MRPASATRPLAATLLCGGLLLAGGCVDEAGQARAEADEELRTLAHELQLASVAAVPRSDATARLAGIARRADGVQGTRAQQQAGDRLATAARLQLAEIELARGIDASTAAARVRSAALAQVRSARRIETLSTELAASDTDDAAAAIATTVEAFEIAVGGAAEAVAELDDPIAELRSLNDADLQRATRLNREANDLRAEARAVGYASGLPSYRQAIELEREANAFEFQVAARQNELTNQLEPQSRLLRTEVESGRGAIERLRGSLSALEDRERQLETAGRAMQEAVNVLVGDIGRLLEASAPAATVQPALTEALEHARAAARGGSNDRIRARLLEGRILAAHAHALRAHAEAIRAAGGLQSLGNLAGEASSLDAQADEVSSEADAALAEVASAAGTDPALEPLARTAEAVRSTLSTGG